MINVIIHNPKILIVIFIFSSILTATDDLLGINIFIIWMLGYLTTGICISSTYNKIDFSKILPYFKIREEYIKGETIIDLKRDYNESLKEACQDIKIKGYRFLYYFFGKWEVFYVITMLFSNFIDEKFRLEISQQLGISAIFVVFLEIIFKLAMFIVIAATIQERRLGTGIHRLRLQDIVALRIKEPPFLYIPFFSIKDKYIESIKEHRNEVLVLLKERSHKYPVYIKNIPQEYAHYYEKENAIYLLGK